jgi:hypothetical protein
MAGGVSNFLIGTRIHVKVTFPIKANLPQTTLDNSVDRQEERLERI